MLTHQGATRRQEQELVVKSSVNVSAEISGAFVLMWIVKGKKKT